MKNIGVILSISAIVLAVLSCEKQKKDDRTELVDLEEQSDFIRMVDGKFYKGSQRFFPIILNYIVSFQQTEDGLVLGPTPDYDQPESMFGNTKEEVLNRLLAHFVLIKDIGFNTVRGIGLDMLNYKERYPSGAMFYFNQKYGKVPFGESLEYKAIDDDQEFLTDGFNDLGHIAEKAGLKLIIALPRPRKSDVFDKVRDEYLNLMISSFKDKASVFAYDFFNEPLYFDNEEYEKIEDILRSKQEAFRLVLSFKKLLRSLGSRQLLTISLAEPIEAFEFRFLFYFLKPLRIMPNMVHHSLYFIQINAFS